LIVIASDLPLQKFKQLNQPFKTNNYLRSLVSGRNLHDTVGVNFESHLDLRNTTRSRRDAGELELAEKVVVLGERTFTLEDLNKDSRLVVGGSGENLTLLGGDDSVARNELGEDSTSGLDTEGEGVDINENDVGSAIGTGEDTTLDGGTVSDCLVGVDSLRRLLAVEKVFEELLDLGNTSGTANKDDLERC
jgi:hypothetical protein